MAFFIVDLEFISNLEITLLKRLKPDEIMLISYIKSFPKGYYGSKDNLAFVLGICRARVFKILKYFISLAIIYVFRPIVHSLQPTGSLEN